MARFSVVSTERSTSTLAACPAASTIPAARPLPSAIFTNPEVATVGIQEHEAIEQGLDVKVGKFPFTALGRAENAVQAFMGVLKVRPEFRLPPGVSPSIRAMFAQALKRLNLSEQPTPGAQPATAGAESALDDGGEKECLIEEQTDGKQQGVQE